MSTRATISVVNKDRTVTSVYCHFDGYPDGTGRVLLSSFNTYTKAKKLVALGNLSTICDGIMAYHRDYDEPFDDNKPLVFKNQKQYNAKINTHYQWLDYNYIFKDGKWYVYDVFGKTDKTVKQAIKDEGGDV